MTVRSTRTTSPVCAPPLGGASSKFSTLATARAWSGKPCATAKRALVAACISSAASSGVASAANPFNDAAARQRLEAAGVRCVVVDLLAGEPHGLPADADYVLNFAVTKTNDWDVDLQANSGGLAWLMEHHRNARAFLHC